MEDFAKVFLIGMFIFMLGILLLGSGPSDDWNNGSSSDTGVIYSSDSLGDIGTVSSRKRSISFGDLGVGYTLGKDSVASDTEVLIQNGIFTKNSKTITFSGADADAAVLEFDIAEMNDYGKLEIYFNNEKIYFDIAEPQKFVLMIDELGEDNTLVISATSSGVKFWAPTTYRLRNLKVTLDKYSDQAKVVPFEVFPYEYSGWGHGTLTFKVDDTEGFENLIATLNGKIIYEGRPLPGDIIEQEFTKSDTSLKVGENLLTLRTEKGASYDLRNTALDIFYYGSGEKNTKVLDFDAIYWKSLMDTHGNLTGKIEFYVEKVNLDSGLDVYLNGRLYEIDHLKEGTWHTLEFGSRDLLEKDNELKFSASGSYQIEQLEVRVEKK